MFIRLYVCTFCTFICLYIHIFIYIVYIEVNYGNATSMWWIQEGG